MPHHTTHLFLTCFSISTNNYISLPLMSSLRDRHGFVTILAVDDGDGDLYNASVSLDDPHLLEVDKQEGVHVGGSPEYAGISVFKIHGDYHKGELWLLFLMVRGGRLQSRQKECLQ